VLRLLRDTPHEAAAQLGAAARAKVLAHHTAAHRAEELERYLCEQLGVTLMPTQRSIRRSPAGARRYPQASRVRRAASKQEAVV
jgi:hypothetical protein